MSSWMLALCMWPACAKPADRADTPPKRAVDDSAAIVSQSPASARDAAAASATPSCVAQPFAPSVDLPEASGATLLADGSILVVGDSDTNGVYVRLDAASGEVLSRGKLDLDRAASDDLEGLSRIGDVVYAITSSGWMRHFEIDGEGFRSSVKSYPIADYDAQELVCKSARDSNCGQNYEGLCLRPDAQPGESCAGFAAAKSSGRLLCLVLGDDGRVHLDDSRAITVARPESLSGCHFDKQGRLWFGTNLFSGNRIGVIEDWQAAKPTKITQLGAVGLGFGEAIAVADVDQVFRFSDTAASPSLLSKYICR